MSKPGWEQNSQFILKSLERIEEKLGNLDDTMRSHADRDNVRFENLALDLVKVDKDMKWHSKIAGGIGSAVAILISVLYGSHR